MEDSRRALEKLSRAALGEPSDFAKLLQNQLVTDFERTLYQIKTQKLILKRRSSAWISGLELNMRDWLARASLKGKQKAQLTRHLTVCKAIQELFETIDRQSCTLRIWQASTRELLRALFASVEALHSEQEARLSGHELEEDDPHAALKVSELLRMELRHHCDYVARIVSQISAIGIREAGGVELSPSDIREAISVAALGDLVMHILDCYSYKNFRVSVEDKHVTLRGIQSRFEEAHTWSSLRDRSSGMLDGHKLHLTLGKLERFALTLPCDSRTFGDFLQSGAGKQIVKASQEVRSEYARILEREVADEIDLDLMLSTRSGIFRARELLECWSLLFQLATCARIWCRTFRKEGIATLPVAQLAAMFSASLACSTRQAERLVSQFSLEPSRRNEDPFFRPLIKLDSQECLIAATFIETGRFSRNLFAIAIREGRVNFSAKGLKPLKSIHQKFLRAGFDTVLNFPIRAEGKFITDIDIAATKDGFLFVGQTKVLLRPDTLYDSWKALDSLRKAANQLRTSLQNLTSLQDRLGLIEGEFLVVPFLLTNIWDYSGATVEGFKVTDFSHLSVLLTGGEIWRVQFRPVPTREVYKLIRGAYPTGEELARLLQKPIHEVMFEKPKLEMHSLVVGDTTVTVLIDTARVPRTKPTLS